MTIWNLQVWRLLCVPECRSRPWTWWVSHFHRMCVIAQRESLKWPINEFNGVLSSEVRGSVWVLWQSGPGSMCTQQMGDIELPGEWQEGKGFGVFARNAAQVFVLVSSPEMPHKSLFWLPVLCFCFPIYCPVDFHKILCHICCFGLKLPLVATSLSVCERGYTANTKSCFNWNRNCLMIKEKEPETKQTVW